MHDHSMAKLVIFFFFVTIAVVKAQEQACKSSGSNEASCICNLNDGSGLVDLTALVQQSKANPYHSPTLRQDYYLVLCGAISTLPNLDGCNNIASSCEFLSITQNSVVIGLPDKTHFQWRQLDGTKKLALAIDAPDIQSRTVVHLTCDPTVTGVPDFTALGASPDKDPDGFTVYVNFSVSFDFLLLLLLLLF